MKIGITIPNYYKEYIEEIAKVNNLTKTAVCGLIIENFITFNKARNMFPLFKRETKLIFKKADSGEKPNESENQEEPTNSNWREQLEELNEQEEEKDSNDLPF